MWRQCAAVVDAAVGDMLTPTLYSYYILCISGSPRIRASCHGLGIPGRVRPPGTVNVDRSNSRVERSMWTAPPPEERAAISSPPVLDARVPNVVVVCRTVPLAAPLRAPRFVESLPYRLLRLDRCQIVALVYLWYV